MSYFIGIINQYPDSKNHYEGLILHVDFANLKPFDNLPSLFLNHEHNYHRH